MSATIQKALTNGAFTALSDGTVTEVFVQLKSDGPIYLEVKQSLPSASSEVGVILRRGGLEEVQIRDLESGDIVYGRSARDEDETVSVLHSRLRGLNQPASKSLSFRKS